MFSICDVLILVIILISALIGFYRGFLKELCTLLTWLGSSYLSIRFYDVIHHRLEGSLPVELSLPISVIILFFISFMSLTVICHFLKTGLMALGLIIIDRPMGLAFGIFRGFFLGGLLLLGILFSPYQGQPWFKKSISYDLCGESLKQLKKKVMDGQGKFRPFWSKKGV